MFSFAQQAAEVVQVVDHVVEVDFQHGRMYLVFEDAADPFELEAASSFQQDAFFREARPVDAPQEIFGGQVELLAAVECPRMFENLFADTDQFGHSVRLQQFGHSGVQPVGFQTALVDVGQDQRFFAVAGYRRQVFQRDAQRVDVRIVAVVDDFAAVDAVFEFQPHRYVLQRAESAPDLRHVVPHYSVQGQRFGRVFARGGVRVGQSVQVAAARVDGDQLPVGIAGRNEAPQQRVAGIVDNRRRVGE